MKCNSNFLSSNSWLVITLFCCSLCLFEFSNAWSSSPSVRKRRCHALDTTNNNVLEPSAAQTISSMGRRHCSCLTLLHSKQGDGNNDDDEDTSPSTDGNRGYQNVSATPQQNNNEENDATTAVSNDIFTRFTNPRIDDPALPLADVLVAQIIAPSLQVAWLSLNHAPSPTWLRPILSSSSSSRSASLFAAQRGSLLAPALIHGAALAVCWLAGVLAARAYERDALVLPPSLSQPNSQTDSESPSNPPNRNTKTMYNENLQSRSTTSRPPPPRGAFVAVLQAGAFATGLLIVATQFDLLREFQFQLVQYGDSPETDFRIQVALVEVINDVVFEAMTLLTWRLFLARQQPPP